MVKEIKKPDNKISMADGEMDVFKLCLENLCISSALTAYLQIITSVCSKAFSLSSRRLNVNKYRKVEPVGQAGPSRVNCLINSKSQSFQE